MTISVENESAASEAVRLMGGPIAAARELNVNNYQTVQSWLRVGIPAKYCARIEAITGVDRKRLRPQDWADYWPDPVVANGPRSTGEGAHV